MSCGSRRCTRRVFREYLQFWEMESADELSPDAGNYVFAKRGETYAVYVPTGGSARLDLEEFSGRFEVRWYDPRNGGELKTGSAAEVSGPGVKTLGRTPGERSRDWVALVRKAER